MGATACMTWQEYLLAEGLLDQETSTRTPKAFPLNANRAKGYRKNLRDNLSFFEEFIVDGFDLQSVVDSAIKSQPCESSTKGFEVENEPMLRLLSGNNCIIRDGSSKREILAIKVTTSGSPEHAKPVIPAPLRTSLESGLYRYLYSNPLCKKDPNRHKSNTNHGTTILPPPLVRPGGPPNPVPTNGGSCHNIHTYSAAQHDQKISDIKLSQGPREVWAGGRQRTQALYQFLSILKPLSTLLEGVFQVTCPETFHIYKSVFNSLPKNDANRGIKDCLGIWTLRGIVLDAFTDVHVDLKDVCKGFCAIVPLGNFTGGNFCLPSLGISIPMVAGEVIFLKFHLIPHYVGQWTGHRFSLVHYTHQVVFDYVQEKRGGQQLFPLAEMPLWYRKRVNDCDVVPEEGAS
ncbi:hypothetical protein L873DRAFT_1842436 [Choiromyces venosus 120613-1]|uniref:Uncharacterized protein n=1 Tax=Choiromyces venosus 120613-1 TaxID=1336337 RepID=A0A3N4JZB4_9PEZI|nr:hypothetical protein L873DRAFT_1842436 [Choiromyces venosus 120613-1]